MVAAAASRARTAVEGDVHAVPVGGADHSAGDLIVFGGPPGEPVVQHGGVGVGAEPGVELQRRRHVGGRQPGAGRAARRHRLGEQAPDYEAALRARRAVIDAQREELLRWRDAGHLPDASLRILEAELDHQERTLPPHDDR